MLRLGRVDNQATPVKLLLLNAHSPRNAGDLAILEASLACLRTAFPAASITVAINDIDDALLPADVLYVRSLTRWLVALHADGTWRWHKALAPLFALWLGVAALAYRLLGVQLLPSGRSRQALMCAYYDADLVAVIGGGHLYAPHRFNIAFLWLWAGLACAVIMRKPLVLLPQSFGPLPGRFQRALLRWLLDHSQFVATREYRSLQLLADIGVKQRVLVLPDLAFCTEQAPLDALATLPALAQARCTQRPLIGVTLMDWGGQNARFQQQQQYETAMVALIEHMIDRYDAQVALFAQCVGPTPAQDDRLVATRIAARLPGRALIRADQPLAPAVLKTAYAQLDLLVATRMHSAIFALSAGVPTLAIGYLHKSTGIMEMLGLVAHTLDIADANTARCLAHFEALWAARADVRLLLAQRIPALQATLAHLPALVSLTEEARS